MKKWLGLLIVILTLSCSMDTLPDYASISITGIESVNKDLGLRISYKVEGEDISYIIVKWGEMVKYIPPESSSFAVDTVKYFGRAYLTVMNEKGESNPDTFSTSIKTFYPSVKMSGPEDTIRYLYWDDTKNNYQTSSSNPNIPAIRIRYDSLYKYTLTPSNGLKMKEITDTLIVPYKDDLDATSVIISKSEGRDYYIGVYDPQGKGYWLVKVSNNKIWSKGIDFYIKKFVDERVKNLRIFGR